MKMVSKFCKIILIINIIILAITIEYIWYLIKPLPVPIYEWETSYWGPGNQSDDYIENTAIIPFKITYPDESIQDLKQQLSRNFTYPPPLEGVAFELGFNTKQLKKLVTYWRDDYLKKWPQRLQFLNKFPHFTTEIQGLKIHFIHQKPDKKLRKTKTVYPILLLHGWPGSVREFYEVIPKLIDPNTKSDYVFEVIVPSLPGYGWSQASSKKGFGPIQMANIFRKLMLRLGYTKFFIQAGDWGSIIANSIVTFFPENVIGYHSNLCVMVSPLVMFKSFLISLWPTLLIEKELVDFYYPLTDKFWMILRESGYFHLQATRPDTAGISVTDNPIGLIAYTLEKFAVGTNLNYIKHMDGGYENDFDTDTLLDNIMIYHMTNSILTSIRIYYEGYSYEQQLYQLERVPTPVLYGCASFYYEIANNFDWVLKDKFTNLIHHSHYRNGGHFAALQVPDILSNDIIQFVEKVIHKTIK